MTVKEIMNRLSEPFTEEELEFKVGATNPDKTMGLALGYVQARAIQIRLDEVLGIDSWRVSYKEIKDGFICRLGIKIGGEWIDKEDGAQTTDFEAVKGGISSAFKRVASSGFGIGRYLYSDRGSWFPIRPKGNNGYEFVSAPKLNVPTKKQSYQRTREVTNDIILNFGKYSGISLREVFEKDKNYVEYLSKNTKDEKIKKSCHLLLG